MASLRIIGKLNCEPGYSFDDSTKVDMDNQKRSDKDQKEVYQIVLKGHLDSTWSDWFGGLTIALLENGETILSGPVVDQAALHGVLMKIRDLGLPLLSLARIEANKENETRSPTPDK